MATLVAAGGAVITLLGFCTSAHARQFMLAGSGVSNETAVLVDVETFSFSGKNKLVSAVYVYASVPPYTNRLMEIVKTEIDCSAQRMRDLSGAAYDPKGELSARYTTPRPWIKVDRDSLAESLIDTMCVQRGARRGYEQQTAFDAAVHVRKLMDDYRRTTSPKR